jgi:CelD/BcsL family acetyltransferase involved in cellulose biosynthesis
VERQIKFTNEVDTSLIDRWKQLWNESEMASFFNSWEWFETCKNTYRNISYEIMTVEEEGKLRVVVPLALNRKWGITTLTIPGEKYADKTPLLLDKFEPQLIREITDKLKEKGNYYLPEVNFDQMNVMTGEEVKMRETSVNSYIPINPDPFRFLSDKQRSKIFNRVKKNAEHLKLETYIGSPEALETAFLIDDRSVKKSRGMASFTDEADKEFFRQLIKNNRDKIVIDILYYDGVPFVYSVGLVKDKIYHAFNTAYDESYYQLLPGKILLHFMLNRLQTEGFETLDFLRGRNTLKMEFTSLTYTQYDVFYSKFGLIRWWWSTAGKIKDGILGNEFAYGAYRQIKKLVY